MFLDDGVSRDSALHNGVKTEGYNTTKEGKGRWADIDLDPEAKNKYREICVEHVRIIQSNHSMIWLTSMHRSGHHQVLSANHACS